MIDFQKMHDAARKQAQAEQDAAPAAPVATSEVVFDEVVLEASSAEGGQQTALIDALGVILALFVVLAPVPLGSNRPVFWLSEAAILGLIGAVFFGLLAVRGHQRALRWERMWPVFALGAVFCLFAVAQAVLPYMGGAGVLASLPDEMRPRHIAVDSAAVWVGLARVLSYLLFALLVAETARNAERLSRLAWIVFWGCVLHAIWGLTALILLDDWVPWGVKSAYEGYATGFFVNRNSYATFLAMGASLGTSLTISYARRPKLRKVGGGLMMGERLVELGVLGLAIGACFLAILASGSRMGLVAALLGCASVVIIWSLKAQQRLRLPVIVAGGLGVVAVVWLFGNTLDRAVFFEDNLEQRLNLYRQVWALIWERPLTGYGLDGFAAIYEIAQRPPVPGWLVWDRAHSTYLALWVEMGIVVGSLPIIGSAVLAYWALRNVLRRQSALKLPVAACGVAVVGASHSLVDFSLEISANVFLFLFVMIIGAARLRRAV